MAVPPTLTVIEQHQLLEGMLCKEGTKKQFRRCLRNYTMACVLLETGLRVGELVQLLWHDLFFNGLPVSMLIVTAEIAKRHRERSIPVSTRLSNALAQYHDSFLSDDGEASMVWAFFRTRPSEPLSTRQVERICFSAGMSSLGHPVNPHMLRHTFGSKLMRVTNARVVQELLGHENLSSTQIYTHPNSDDLKLAVDKLASVSDS